MYAAVGNVEDWLCCVELAMKRAVKVILVVLIKYTSWQAVFLVRNPDIRTGIDNFT